MLRLVRRPVVDRWGAETTAAIDQASRALTDHLQQRQWWRVLYTRWIVLQTRTRRTWRDRRRDVIYLVRG